MAEARSLQTPAWLRTGGLLGGFAAAVLLLALPAPAGLSAGGQAVLATAALMAVWWITEALPIPVTALLPLVLFPLLGVMPMADTAAPYGHHLVFLFLGGFVLALAVERSGLHRRIALRVILIVGEGPSRLVFGFMLATAVLSMWISNTATVMLMLPIALAVIDQMRGKDESRGGSPFAVALLLGLAYSASIGGVATLIGTPPNIVLAGVLAKLYPAAPEIGFVEWMMFGLPVAVIFLPICWLLLVRVLPASRLRETERKTNGGDALRQALRALGPMQRSERLVLAVFLLTAAGWVFRAPLNIGALHLPGLTLLFPEITDATVAMASALLLFLLPGREGGALFSWNEIQRGIPWGILLLFGGGFALAEGMRQSGVTLYLGSWLVGLEGLPLWLTILLICTLLSFLTELTSNTATATILLPVLGSAAVTLGYNPLLFMVPAALNASFAFMLPVATPPNAIIFSSSFISIRQMAATGFLLNIVGVLLVTGLMLLLGMEVFAIDPSTLPTWVH
ncbi:MAG: SLC13/DASS family transporter [Bacteroidetes bacterium]|nr:SLC13/DASS family transporter [Bacteroidota bacterium]